ncbi:sulfur oxidation c-type cytochrome SoxX [Arcobacter porcinus]|uniref:Sulfur oxidation protein SoxXA, monoheme cytochrome c subunit n=1 Tax=Arcobacter porcinus TaxID=1935204 RepID=A0A5C2HKG5_9BACT|nr:sulfur oxidation c-type cytochrome SoxX [Arcobacter porcinus]OCL87929.1 Cytochrome c [Arcobacter porcinus]OCL94423.1 Cytochrome c [Aliarcobacter thereius]QEP41230.1 sulfur oxidation protein SoxXA, monoheme cytochrome c subunit [Arcobacter porcinus]
MLRLIKRGLLVAIFALLFATVSSASDEELIKKGEVLYNTNTKGNCIACHDANGKELDGPGTLGPKLQFLEFWPDEALYNKIFDPATGDPITAMPAFGKNGWLSDDEIKAIVAYLKTIK